MAGLGEALADSFRIYAVDWPGHGESPRLEGAPEFARYARALADFLAEHDLRGVALVGHSMGGVLSVMTAGFAVERVAAVVNLDGAMPLTAAGREGYARLFARMEREGFHATMESFLREALFLPQERGTPEMERLMAEMLSGPEDLARALSAQFPTYDAAGALERCPGRPLYIGGAKPRFDAEAVRAVRPGTEFAVVPESGHFVQIFALERVAALVREFLGLVDRRS